eukprot:753623-Hanusia_phi.AAC.1
MTESGSKQRRKQRRKQEREGEEVEQKEEEERRRRRRGRRQRRAGPGAGRLRPFDRGLVVVGASMEYENHRRLHRKKPFKARKK